MNPIEKLTEYFSHFPGIGPRQAKRFVYYLLHRDKQALEEFSQAIKELHSTISACSECFRYFASKSASTSICGICADQTREKGPLMIVPRDNDLEQIEKSKAYNGQYFVLGGTLPILEKNPESRIRIANLKRRINKDKAVITELILAANWNPEGENTMEFVAAELKPLLSSTVKISHLGRGFSTGTEIEYSDSETIKYALKNRF